MSISRHWCPSPLGCRPGYSEPRLWALRVFPALAGGASVVFTALTARELGGRWRAQVLAALAASTSPQILAAFHLLSTTAFDIFFWSAITLMVVRLLRTGNEQLWLAVGALTGIALVNKFNVAFLVVGLAAGLILGGRSRMLGSPWLWAGCALALAIWSPNIVWNAQHDWAAVAMMHSLHEENSTLGASLAFIPEQLIVVGPVLAVFSIAGLRRLFRHPFGRPLGLRVPRHARAVLRDRCQVLLPRRRILHALRRRRVWAEERLVHRTPAKGVRGWVALMVAGAVVAMPITLPVLPTSALAKGPWEGEINKDLSATVGWPSLVGQIATIANRLPVAERANLVIFTGDYGAAGAVDLYGAGFGLPHAISGHNTYWWWGPVGAKWGDHDCRRPAKALSADDLHGSHSRGHGDHSRRRVDRGAGRPDLDLSWPKDQLGPGMAGRTALRVAGCFPNRTSDDTWVNRARF